MIDYDENGKIKGGAWAGKLQELARKIPGLTGFMDREKIREQDKLLREHNSLLLEQAKDGLRELQQALLGQLKLGLLPELDKLTSQLDRLRAKHRFDAYGYSGAFDVQKILEPELARLYDYDAQIMAKTEKLIGLIESKKQTNLDDSAIRSAVDELRVEIAALAELIDNRREQLSKVER